MGGFRWVCFFGNAGWPGLGGRGGGWAGMTVETEYREMLFRLETERSA